MPIHFAKVFKNDDPTIVVIITIIKANVLIKSTLLPVICKHNAKAIAPLTIPEYQQTFNYFPFSGKFFLNIE